MQIIIRLDDISNYLTILENLKPMLKKGCECFIEKRPILGFSGNTCFDYYLHILKK